MELGLGQSSLLRDSGRSLSPMLCYLLLIGVPQMLRPYLSSDFSELSHSKYLKGILSQHAPHLWTAVASWRRSGYLQPDRRAGADTDSDGPARDAAF